MSKYTTPIKLNGTQLRNELRAAGIDISNETGSVVVINNDLFLDIKDQDTIKANAVVLAHQGIDVILSAKDALLQRLGITADEALLLLE